MAAYDSAYCLAWLNRRASRPSVDEITDATKYQYLAEAQQKVVADIASRAPHVLYGPTYACYTTDHKVFTFGTDPDGYAVVPIGKAKIFSAPSNVPDYPLREGLDYLNEGSQIRIPNDGSYSGTLYWRGIIPTGQLSATLEPALLPPPARSLIVLEAARCLLQDNSQDASALTVEYAHEFARWMLTFRTQYVSGGALLECSAFPNRSSSVASTITPYVWRLLAYRIVAAPTTLSVAETFTTAAITTTVYNVSGDLLPFAPVTFTSDDPSVASVDATTGVVTGVASGTTTIVATSGSASVEIPVTVTFYATHLTFVSRFNALGTAQITRGWKAGVGHSLGAGRKAAWVDYVGNGATLTPGGRASGSYGTGPGLLYDDTGAVPRMQYSGEGMTWGPTLELAENTTRKTLMVVGATPADTGAQLYYMHVGDGSHGRGLLPTEGGTTYFKINGGDSTGSLELAAKPDGSVTCATLSVYGVGIAGSQMQGYMKIGRDLVQSYKTSPVYNEARQLEIGPQYGSPTMPTGDVRGIWLITGDLTAAQEVLRQDYAILLGVVEDTSKLAMLVGNSLVAQGWGANLKADMLADGWKIVDLGKSGYSWATLTDEHPQVAELCINPHRTKSIKMAYEYANSWGWSTGAHAITGFTPAQQLAAVKAFMALILTSPSDIPVWITPLPDLDSAGAYNTTDSLGFEAARQSLIALMLADSTIAAQSKLRLDLDARLGPYTALASLPSADFQSDGRHLIQAAAASGNGNDRAAALTRTLVLTL